VGDQDRHRGSATHGHLVLWDIDGTLVHGPGTGLLAFRRAFVALTGHTPSEAHAPLPGWTDRQAVLDELARLGLPAGLAEPTLARMATEFAALGDVLAESGRALPGAAAILRHLAEDKSVTQSVLTGNSEGIARQKLATFGLADHLDLDAGAYGDVRGERGDLLLLAWENQRRLRGASFGPESTWVVGDTPRDLACARAHGARCLLVATGQYPLAELAPLGADAVVPDLLDGPRVLAALGLAGGETPDGSRGGTWPWPHVRAPARRPRRPPR
jgi:phosphoglycolate phosphatase-like HAD superfamily hydrolase